MNWPASLQGRLALGLGLALTALWLAASAWTVADLRHEMEEVFDSALQETAQRLLPLAVVEIVNRDPDTGAQRLAAIREHKEHFIYVVRDASGAVLMQSHAGDQAVFPDWNGSGFHQTDTHRIYTEATMQGSIRLTVAEPLAHRQEAGRKILLSLALPLVLVAPLTLFAVVMILRIGLSGLRRFRERLAGRGARDLSPVPLEGLPTELTPIADTVNDLLARLSDAFEAERGFAANVAHELRTPLAGAIAQAQRLRAEIGDAAMLERVAAIETTLKRLTRTAERLLQLARAEGGRLLSDAPADPRAVLRIVTSDVARDTTADRLRLDLPDTRVLSDLDPDVLAIVARNLIDNALRHGQADAPVEVTLDPAGVLTVANDGPVIPPEQLSGLTEQFVRAGTADGSGLGLAIVAAIARRAGLELALRSPRPGWTTGFEARIGLRLTPVSPTP